MNKTIPGELNIQILCVGASLQSSVRKEFAITQ